ncbi:UDP-N-acetylmuramoylalanyl-D-glutamyl-2,6-diaminopimelate--D-alanyl-D-alanine ligase [Oceanicola granulosus HTCC2516]|uniref:UDP-N-acetylmuramoyl-tripeptide--D-alanyl-D-alanine ligase n=1 Tax=Oceanicola granulosus (strain ATCC BAA-861 / DSM 15982 / KCTC 12143 / HTCC2516) TaxID=314256 RepID=Q2CIJ1_OCEGH|nr:UDP-N-acetylmuramoyl-tripeptide--D-alanyl-D-alanine ligase [Oceanicola granulosus]EAR52598.1 UDP-N-acetylmuramoylalanyl-D-glutamyl-2,6-diaminopimelate--D-alanyl-D-alanine ligase [Oceanicola granulosus HTCC2516]
MALWTAAEAARATGGDNRTDWTADGVSIDTRTLAPGDLFVALKAARDGHEFVAQALEKGAAAALVTHRPEGVAADAPLLVVPDVLAALEALGRAARARTNARVAAITGSVGKTSSKEMLRAALERQGRTHAAEASYNNHWGVPLTLARMPADTEYAIVEIGMNHPGEIAPLARLARPHVAMVTIVAPAHLEAFDSIEGIAREKASIFEGLEPGGTAIINGDLPTTPILRAAAEAAGAEIVSFGTQAGNHHRLTDIKVHEGCTVASARLWRTEVHLKVATEGAHFAVNALGCLATAAALGADRSHALMGLACWAPPPGRGTRETLVLDDGVAVGAIELIDDAFNANPASLAAALEVLAAARPRDDLGHIGKGRRIAILGDMLELGPEAAGLHAAVADEPAMAHVDLVHCVGPLMRELHRALPDGRRGRWVENAEDLAAKAARLVDPGDVVLVKGSKGSRVSRVVDAIRKLGHRSEMSEQEA